MKRRCVPLLAVCLMLLCSVAMAQEWVIPPPDKEIDPVFLAGPGGPFDKPGSPMEILALPQAMLDALKGDHAGNESPLAMAQDEGLTALVLKKGKRNLFIILAGSPPTGYEVVFRSEKLLRQGDPPMELYLPGGQQKPRRIQLVCRNPEPGVAHETLVMLEPEGSGDWMVGSYSVQMSDGRLVRFEPQGKGEWKLTEWFLEQPGSASFLSSKKMKPTLQDFSLADFPKSFDEAKKRASWWYTVMPSDYETGLIKFPRSKNWPVYTGPGEEYFRAANGKALVSTNGTIDVVGWEKGWLMVRYLVTKTRALRVGFIKADALPKGTKVELFAPVMMDAELVEDALLTDDVVKSAVSGLVNVRKGSSGQLLKIFNHDYAYLEFDLSGMGLTRGFVPMESVILPGENFRVFEGERGWMSVYLSTGGKGTHLEIDFNHVAPGQQGTPDEIRVWMEDRLLGTSKRLEASAGYEALDIPEYQGVLSFVQVWDGVPDAGNADTLDIPGTMLSDFASDARQYSNPSL